mmetsp:Transcript_23910/g.66360  ORF Transcript_23910/g.66360 Transcript_23910/m.66360 type:complete len:261 (+) Transcript_23910:391-1173(+)
MVSSAPRSSPMSSAIVSTTKENSFQIRSAMRNSILFCSSLSLSSSSGGGGGAYSSCRWRRTSRSRRQASRNGERPTDSTVVSGPATLSPSVFSMRTHDSHSFSANPEDSSVLLTSFSIICSMFCLSRRPSRLVSHSRNSLGMDSSMETSSLCASLQSSFRKEYCCSFLKGPPRTTSFSGVSPSCADQKCSSTSCGKASSASCSSFIVKPAVHSGDRGPSTISLITSTLRVQTSGLRCRLLVCSGYSTKALFMTVGESHNF